jgi:hypothetical protein
MRREDDDGDEEQERIVYEFGVRCYYNCYSLKKKTFK